MAHQGFVRGRRLPLELEAQVVRMLQEGVKTRVIAAELGLSTRTPDKVAKRRGVVPINPQGNRAEPFSRRTMYRYKRQKRQAEHRA